MQLNEVCFLKGTIVDCDSWASDGWGSDGHSGGDGWGSDGHGDGWYGDGNGEKDDDGDDDGNSTDWGSDGHKDDDKSSEDDDNNGGGKGDIISVPFTYTVGTDGKKDPESVITPLENAILDDVAEYVEDNDDFSSFTGKISAAPEDYIADDEFCGEGHVRCSVVKGEMNFYIDESTMDDDAWAGDGFNIDDCAAINIIKESMEGQDYSEDVEGVLSAKYKNSDSKECEEEVIAGAAIIMPTETDDDSSAAAAFLVPFAAAALALLALLAARKFRRKPVAVEEEPPVKEDISLISNSLNGSFLGGGEYEDPYANTIDVHKCTSIYCNCNKDTSETDFLPVPKKVDMAKTMMALGFSPTAVNQADGEFFCQPVADEKEEEDDPELDHSGSFESKGSIMRVPIRSQLEQEDRPLTPVNEVLHDSEIDTELEESVMGDQEGTLDGQTMNDETTVPPPPPLFFHPAYQQGTGQVHLKDSEDEISI